MSDLEDRLDREVERLGGIYAAQKVIDRDPPPPGLRKGSLQHTIYVLMILECAETA